MSDESTGKNSPADGSPGRGSPRNPLEAKYPLIATAALGASEHGGAPKNTISEPAKPKPARGSPDYWKSTCGAKTKSGSACRRPPVAGRTRCRLHGGATPYGIASPHFRHGLRSKYVSDIFTRPPSPLDAIAAMQAQGMRIDEIAARLARRRQAAATRRATRGRATPTR